MSIALKMTVTGLNQLRKQTAKAGDDWAAAMSGATYQKGFAIMADSTAEVPVDKGFLKGSAYVAPPKNIRDPLVEIGYGKKYGPRVHETHKTKSHFLSGPTNRHKSGYTRWIQGKARENYKRGIGWRGVSGPLPARPKEGGG